MRKNIFLFAVLVLFVFSACHQMEKETPAGIQVDLNEQEKSINSETDDYKLEDITDFDSESAGGFANGAAGYWEDKDGNATVTLYNASDSYASAATELKQNPPKKKTIKKDQKIIKTGKISLEVEDFLKSKKQIFKTIQAHDGYIAHQDERNLSHQKISDLIIRIPSKNFDKLLDEIPNFASNVDFIKSNSQDVSEQFVDLKSRLKTKREVLERYQGFLKKAKKIQDILDIEEKIRRIQEEIEAKVGRLKFLKDQVSWSTINLEFYQNIEKEAIKIESPGFWKKMGKNFASGWNGILAMLLFLANIWPILILTVLVLLFLKARIKKSKMNEISEEDSE